MKSKSTIKREISRLKAIADDESLPKSIQGEAYEAYHALRWAIGDLRDRPSTLLRNASPIRRSATERKPMPNPNSQPLRDELAQQIGLVSGRGFARDSNEDPPMLYFKDGKPVCRVADWAPDSDQRHLAVVLREVELISENTPMPPKHSIVEDVPIKALVHRILRQFNRPGFDGEETFIHLFAHNPLMIAEACAVVLRERKP